MVVICKTACREYETSKKARYCNSELDQGQPSTAAKWLHRDRDCRIGKDRPGRPCMISEEQLEAIDKGNYIQASRMWAF